MKCHEPVPVWKGINSRDDLKKFIPAPWAIVNFVGYEEARKRSDTEAGAICAVPKGIDTPCEELKQGLHDAIDKAMFPDDGEDESDC